MYIYGEEVFKQIFYFELLCIFKNFIWKRLRTRDITEGERKGETDSLLSVMSHAGLNPRTLRSWLEPKADAWLTEPPRCPWEERVCGSCWGLQEKRQAGTRREHQHVSAQPFLGSVLFVPTGFYKRWQWQHGEASVIDIIYYLHFQRGQGTPCPAEDHMGKHQV